MLGNISKYILVAFSVLVFGCKKDTPKQPEEVLVEPTLEISEPKKEEVKTAIKKDLIIDGKEFEEMLDDLCGVENIKVINIYDHDGILNDAEKKSFVVQKLKKEGFEIASWGRGNSEKGPRVISYELRSDDCVCHVIKSYETVKDGSLEIYDTITCF